MKLLDYDLTFMAKAALQSIQTRLRCIDKETELGLRPELALIIPLLSEIR